MINHLLDTNVIIMLFRGDRQAKQFVSTISQLGEVSISVVTRAEILAGMKLAEEKTTRVLLNSFTNVPVDSAIADQAGKLIYAQARQGFQLTFPDALIAATALLDSLTIVTTNVKHFSFANLSVRAF